MLKRVVSIVSVAALLVFSLSLFVGVMADMPEKPEKLSIIALDIDVMQFGKGVELFEETYGIEVEWLEFPYGELWDQITTSIIGGSTFDLYMMSNSWHPELGKLGMALPLDEIVSPEELAAINDRYFDITIDFISSHGHQWAFPGTAATVSFFYNKKILNELGYSEPPATFDEVIKISREAIDAGLASYGFFPGYTTTEDGMVQFDIMLKLHGGSWLNEDNSEWVFNSEAGVAALTLMKELLDDGIVPRASLEQSDWVNMYSFLAGETPFEINWNFVHSMAIDPDQSDIVGDFGVGIIPSFVEGEGYTVLGGGGYAISPSTRSPEWSLKLLDYMHREEGAFGVMRDQGGAEGTIKAIYENPEAYGFSPEEYPLMETFIQQMEFAGLRPSDILSWYSEFRDNIFTPAMHRALLGQQCIEEALDQAQREAQEMLEMEGH